MSTSTRTVAAGLAEFITSAAIPAAARDRAAVAFCDTIGVILAGAPEPTAQIVRAIGDGAGDCHVLGTRVRASAAEAALANGVAAHALDYDDMCFVSMAHPSCALVPAALVAAELSGAPGRTVLDGYVAGFEVECRLGAVMNPRHYHQRGWHCTSSIGTVGAAAAAARVLGLDAAGTTHALGIAASLACGLKENLGTMVKPLHAGMAAQHGVVAAKLAARGFVASEHAIDGPQGYLAVMDSERPEAFAEAAADLGSRWEMLTSGVTVKLYPSCAATHPPLDLILDLARRHAIAADDVEQIDVEVDSMTPRLLLYDRPATALEAKFSLPFCIAAALVFGHPTVDTFNETRIRDPRVQRLLPRVGMRANTAYDAAAPLSQAAVELRRRDGNVVSGRANGARGYPGRLSDDELATKFMACAERSVPRGVAEGIFQQARAIGDVEDVRAFCARCALP